MSLTTYRRNGLSMQERVITEMRRQIITGELAPGDNLSEIALAESFGVSRTPVREALKQLETEGLVEIRPRVGTFVTTPSRRQFIELFEMKELLEGAAARMLACRGQVPELERLKINVLETDHAVATQDGASYARHVEAFHELLIVGSDNAKLEAHYRMLMNQLAYTRLLTTSLDEADRLLQANHEHRRALQHIVAKDGDTAERIMREDVRATRRALMAGLDASFERIAQDVPR
jgi:DNA-binding GntR family transcriptional regulator